MSAPDRIWAEKPVVVGGMDLWHEEPHWSRTEYVRADIAADLLAALEAAEESIAEFMGVHGYSADSGAGEILRQVSAAIARARGVA